ncbi:cell division cycle and apoptosis regulator protein 1-like, partial [Piliocolobus tephrosceles]|uniref:cell division cycle and apoptosis regulator protein 1-like n=1 Tax=Piliocolobus tephrosceles TaxID=591936 RepID=UPI000E6B2F47
SPGGIGIRPVSHVGRAAAPSHPLTSLLPQISHLQASLLHGEEEDSHGTPGSQETDRDEEEMTKQDDKRDINRHCKERPSKDKMKMKKPH